MAPKGPIGPRFDLTGKRFARLTAVKPVQLEKNGKSVMAWQCRCDCGNKVTVVTVRLRNGDVKSCGCLKVDTAIAIGHANRTHGDQESPEYRAWVAMRNRCNNPNHQMWRLYGGSGVKVCKRWNKYENFLADMGRKPSPKHSLDRYPNCYGDYKPSNCRWATLNEQNGNRRPWKRRTAYELLAHAQAELSKIKGKEKRRWRKR